MKKSLPASRRDVGLRRRLRVRRAGAAALLAAGCGVAVAAPDLEAGIDPNPLHLSGFGTFGVVHVDSPAGTGFLRDVSERPNTGGTRADIDTRVGLQANYRLSSQIELVGQVVGANRASGVPPSDFVSLAFAAWRWDGDITLRTGRMSTDYYLLADYRNVGFAYPFVRPPVENYGAVPYLLDGLDLTKAWHVGETVWALKAITGLSHTDQGGTKVTVRPFYGIVLTRDDGDGLLLRGSASRVVLHGDSVAVQPLTNALDAVGNLPDARVAAEARALSAAFDYDSRFANYFSVGLNYDRDAWLASIEVSRCEPERVNSYTSAWGIVGRRFGAFTAYGGMSAIRTRSMRSAPQWTAALTPLLGPTAAAQAQQLGTLAAAAAALTTANQRSVTLGMRWDLSDRVALKLQWDRVRVDPYGGRLWTTRSPTEPIAANVGSATLDFIF